MMNLSRVAVVLIAGVMLAGCMGPSKSGKEARTAANARMNLVSAQIQYDQARQLFGSGQFEKALREINNAIGRYPDACEYYVLQGRIYLETHKLEAAAEAFQTGISKDEKAAEPHYYLGIVFQRWSDDEQAFTHYRTAFELDDSKVQYLLAAAESLIALGEFDAAVKLIEPKLARFEHNAALKQLQAQIALLQGNPKQAAAFYSQARLLNPDDDMLLEELMWAQYAAEMYGQCHETLKRLQNRSKRERFDLLHLEARCLAMLNRSVEARELYLKLTRMRPSDVTVWSELGTLAWEVGDYRNVAASSTQLISLAPQRYEGYMFRGINEREKGRLSEAILQFRKATERAPETAMPHLLLGQTFEQAGQNDHAIAAYNAALRAEPDNAQARELLRRLNNNQRVTAAPTP